MGSDEREDAQKGEEKCGEMHRECGRENEREYSMEGREGERKDGWKEGRTSIVVVMVMVMVVWWW